jgi:hypothetical protein
MRLAGLNALKLTGKYVYLNAHCPGSRDLNWTGKGLKATDFYFTCNCNMVVIVVVMSCQYNRTNRMHCLLSVYQD